MRALRHPVVHWVLGAVIGGLFLYASLDKIAQPAEFARVVYHYQLVGPSATIGPWVPNTLAVTLPWIEALTGLLLVFGAWRREAGLLASVMLAVFVVAVGSALARGIDIENCGCFTVSGEGRRAGLGLIAGDLALLAGTLVLAGVRPAGRAETPAAAALTTAGPHA